MTQLQLPRGLYRIGFALLDGDGEPGDVVISTRPRRLAMNYQSDTFDIEGGDIKLEQDENNQRYELELETAGLELAFVAAIEGTEVMTDGSDDTLVTTITKNVLDNQRAPGRLQCQQRDKSGGHTVYTFPKVTGSGSPTMTANQGEYATPTMGLIAYPATEVQTGPPAFVVADLYQIEQAATFVDITP